MLPISIWPDFRCDFNSAVRFWIRPMEQIILHHHGGEPVFKQGIQWSLLPLNVYFNSMRCQLIWKISVSKWAVEQWPMMSWCSASNSCLNGSKWIVWCIRGCKKLMADSSRLDSSHLDHEHVQHGHEHKELVCACLCAWKYWVFDEAHHWQW